MTKIIEMIINEAKNGQLGNRLFYLAHLIGCSIESGHTIIDYSLDEYSKYFKGTYKQSVFTYPRQYKLFSHYTFRKYSLPILIWLKKRLNKNSQFILDHNKIKYQTSTEAYFEKIKKSTFLICVEWVNREFLKLEKYKTEINAIFEPKDEYLKRVEDIIYNARKSSDLLIGIHIRRGDYREHVGGRYYFDDESYCIIMKEITELFATKTITFYLCSNEPINKINFGNFKIQLGSNHIIEDLYCLAKCDYIAGPPSTYSGWASYYGDVPLHSIIKINKSGLGIKLDDFKICNDRLSWFSH